jgi:hypothetical protein
MNKKVSKFLEFNSKTLMFLSENGQWWIALKPICEALGVNWKYQHDKLIKDKNLGQLSRNIGMVALDGKIRKMTSLPETVIYGWIFKLESVAEGMYEYQWKCYNALYNHFHGAITGRKELLAQKAKAQLEMDEVMNTLDSEQAIKYDRAKRKLNQVTAQLRKMDGEIIQEEKNLFNT